MPVNIHMLHETILEQVNTSGHLNYNRLLLGYLKADTQTVRNMSEWL